MVHNCCLKGRILVPLNEVSYCSKKKKMSCEVRWRCGREIMCGGRLGESDE